LTLLSPGCEELQYEGFLSKSMRIELFNDIPIAYMSLEGASPVAAAVDTAAPLMIADRRSAAGYEDRDVRLLEALECTLDCHCTDAAKPLCDSGTGTCVKTCAADTDCKDSRRPSCDAAIGRCLPKDGKECASDKDCKHPSRPSCGANLTCLAPAKLCEELKKDPSRTRCKDGKCVVFNARFMFRELEVHNFEVKPVGLGATTPLGGLLGAPLLRHFTVRLDYAPANPSLTLLNGIPDSTEDLADDCKHPDLASWDTAKKQRCLAVVGTPLVGGGLIEFGPADKTTETELKATRLTVPLCLMPLPFNRDAVKAGDSAEKPKHGAAASSGVAAHAVLATGLGTSVIARSAFERLKAWDPTISVTSGATLNLPYGKETVSTVTLARVAVVSSETRWLGPCGELALRRRLLVGSKVGLSKEDDAMLKDKTFNGASAAILSSSKAFTITFAVLDDSSDLLQGLRNELRPQTPDVDVVLGGSVLKNFVVEIDYPNDRTIFRCAARRTPDQCEILPFCAHPDNSNRTQIRCPLEATKEK